MKNKIEIPTLSIRFAVITLVALVIAAPAKNAKPKPYPLTMKVTGLGVSPEVPEVSREVRAKVAAAELKAELDVAVLYVKGMTCPSCAIGIRVKLGKLEFVDRNRFKRGMKIDVKHQLLTVALKKGAKPDWVLLDVQINNAGYVAVDWFSLEKDGPKSHPFLKIAE
jgi:copper chaperone CopZ